MLSGRGANGIVKTGTGTLVLSNPANTWERLQVEEGKVRVAAAGVIPDDKPVTLFDNTTLDLNGINQTIGSLSGASLAIIQLGAGTLTVRQSVDGEFTGRIMGLAAAGTLQLLESDQIEDTVRVVVNAPGVFEMSKRMETIGSLAGNGLVNVGAGTLRVGADGTSTQFDGVITGDRTTLDDSPESTYRVVKVGDGELRLTGDNTPGQFIVIVSGRLVLDGKVHGAGVQVRDAGRLRGTGTVVLESKAAATGSSVIEVTGSGTVVPGGQAPGILHADQVVFREGLLVVQLAGLTAGSGYSQLELTTSLVLSKTRLSVNASSSLRVPKGSRFTIVNMKGAIRPAEGTFADLPEGGTLLIGGQTFSITYRGGTDGNDVVLTALDNPPAITYFLSEGATGGFFDEDVLIANPQDRPAPVTLTFSKENGDQVVATRTVPAMSRVTVRVDTIPGLEGA